MFVIYIQAKCHPVRLRRPARPSYEPPFRVLRPGSAAAFPLHNSAEDLSPTISMGLTLDHAVSMLIPLGGGWLWTRYGFTPVFLVSGLIALVNLALAVLIDKDRPHPDTLPS